MHDTYGSKVGRKYYLKPIQGSLLSFRVLDLDTNQTLGTIAQRVGLRAEWQCVIYTGVGPNYNQTVLTHPRGSKREAAEAVYRWHQLPRKR